MIVLLKRVKVAVNTHKPIKAALNISCIIVVLFIIYAVGYVYFEKVSVTEGVWQGWQTFTTVGYGNAPAITHKGRIFSIIFGTVGIGSMALLIAIVSDMRQYFKERERLGFMNNNSKGGYIIINWPGKLAAIKIVNQLKATESSIPICFIDSELEMLPPSMQTTNNIHYYRGNLTDKLTYQNANIKNSKAVFVFPKNPESADADISTKSVVELVLKFASEDVNIIYMLCNPENKWLFPKNATPIMKNFWVFAMVQEVQDKYSSALIEKLVNNADGESITSLVVEGSPTIKWCTATKRLHDQGINVIGLRKFNSEETHLLPKMDDKIETGDVIFLACKNNQNLQKIHREVFY